MTDIMLEVQNSLDIMLTEQVNTMMISVDDNLTDILTWEGNILPCEVYEELAEIEEGNHDKVITIIVNDIRFDL